MLLLIVSALIPSLSYSQSKSKYPKQTIIAGDTVVILSLQQANEMNLSFLQMQERFDSINSIADTLKTVVLNEQFRTKDLERIVAKTELKLENRYIRQERLAVTGNVILSISVFAVFLFVTSEMNKL